MTTFGPYPGVVVKEHDGDTFKVMVTTPPHHVKTDVGWGVHVACSADVLVTVRSFGDNAPELSTPAGKAALAHLVQLMPIGTKVQLLSHGWDKYARTDASITLPSGADLAAQMIADGFASPWNGEGPKPVPTGG